MSLISNALKNLFNLLGQKTPTNNGVTSSDLVPLLNSSHAPKGDVSITDLASVLGGASTIELITSGLSDYDNLHGGWYFCGAGYSAEDRPEKSSGFVLNKKQGASSGLQVYFPMNKSAFYTRTHSGEAWSVWFKYTGVAI